MPVGTNPGSRWALLCALSEEGRLAIDSYVNHTIDWSRTPEGHYYSNKAPGPALLAFPVFKLLDGWQTRGIADRAERDRIRYLQRGNNTRLLSFLFQVFPFFALVFWWLRRLERQGVSRDAVAGAAMALLLGNTACVFLNSFFGHGVTAVCALATLAAAVQGSVAAAAFFFGWALLCDYSAAVLLLPLGLFWIPDFRASPARGLWFLRLVVGAAVPAVLWIGYHQICFGGPFTIANAFQNPLFIEPDASRLGGILSLPNPVVAWELLFGTARGLLWTQPWVLVMLAAPWLFPIDRAARFAFVTFALLFAVNAAFNGWHGGDSAGPRYLAAGLALMGVALGLVWDGFSSPLRAALRFTVSVAVVFQLVLFSVYRMPHYQPLWRFFRDELVGEKWATPVSRLALTLPIALLLIYRTWRERPNKSPSSRPFSPAAAN